MPDYWRTIPDDVCGNLRWRLRVRRAAERDVLIQRALMKACREDFLFWINGFCWLYEPRPRVVNGKMLPFQIPFITWNHQVPLIQEIRANLGMRDIGVEKSRGEGMSWIGTMFALHDFLFEPMANVGLVSSSEKKTDNPDNPDSLFWKLDWQLSKLPNWMSGTLDTDYTRNRTDHVLKNLRNGSTLVGFSAVAGVGRGGRYKWFLMDELGEWDRGKDSKAMASTSKATNCRLVISTPLGNEGAYYDFIHQPSNAVRLRLHWSDNPTKNRGLYRIEKGKFTALDPESNPLPENYERDSVEMLSRLRVRGFKVEGVLRSPWYDYECDRADSTPTNIARELDLDYGGSQYRIFGTDFFEKANSTVQAPRYVGDVSYNPETLEGSFDQVDSGPFRIWCNLDSRWRPPDHPYVFGGDVCAGLGGRYSSNSTLVGFDVVTAEQVLEFASNTIEPGDFCDLAIAVCKLFFNAFLVWEHNGPGVGFTQQVIKRRYMRAYRRQVQSRRSKKRTKLLGWWTSETTKEYMFSEFNKAVRQEGLVLRSRELVQECGQYVRLNGKIAHVLATTTDDDSSKGAAHGDRVVGGCVALQGILDQPLTDTTQLASEKKQDLDNPPRNTFAWRAKVRADAMRPLDDEWDDRTNDDLAGAVRMEAAT